MTLARFALPAAAILLGVTGCGGSSDSTASDSTPSSPKPVQTCKLTGLSGTAGLKKVGDALQVTFTGQPPHASDRSVYSMQVSDADASQSLSLRMSFEDGKPADFGTVDKTATLTSVPGRAEVSGDTITGRFPLSTKGLSGMDIALWAPDVLFIDDNGHGQCNQGQMLPFRS